MAAGKTIVSTTTPSDNVIDPVRLHVESHGQAGPVMALACRTFDRARWLQKWRQAEQEKDYHAMDRLDREYEMIGLP